MIYYWIKIFEDSEYEPAYYNTDIHAWITCGRTIYFPPWEIYKEIELHTIESYWKEFEDNNKYDD